MIPVLESALGNLVNGIITRFFPNKSEDEKNRLAAELQILVAESELLKSQLEINKAEASSSDRFVSGWRPFIGWVCGIAFAWQYVAIPIITCLASLVGSPVNLPYFNMEALMPVLLGLLGLAGYRTYEKVKLGK
jgi:hypothetical protein